MSLNRRRKLSKIIKAVWESKPRTRKAGEKKVNPRIDLELQLCFLLQQRKLLDEAILNIENIRNLTNRDSAQNDN